MRQVISGLASALVRSLHRGLILVIALGLFSIAGWFAGLNQPSYAAVSTPEEALQEIQRDQAKQDRQAFYKQQVQITEQPKTGAEQEYEQNIEQYYQEHPEEAGVIEGAKELVDKVTGNN
jgi:hypothetical protein